MAGIGQQEALCNDVFYDVLRCADGLTLARAGCVNSSLRYLSRDEALWEELCAKQWPSTRDPSARKVIETLGGFRKLYSECSRAISIPEPRFWQEQRKEQKISNSASGDTEIFPDLSPCSSNFASMVDVVFQGQVVFSKFIDGIPGAEDFAGWFLGCPFRVDLVQSVESNEEEFSAPVYNDEDHSGFVNPERRYGKLWKEIWNHMKLSWILVDKESKQMANVSSWRPVVGQRHWPTDMDCLLRYGSIIPATTSFPTPVECCIVLKCRILLDSSTTHKKAAVIKLTELSMQLKDVVSGEHLSGRFGLPVLKQAVASLKSREQELLLSRHRKLLKLQSDLKALEMRQEWRLDVYTFVFVLAAAFLFFLFAR